MTTHTDLIARLRSGWTTDCLLAANALEALDQQVAELTAQRDRAEQQVKELLWDDPVEPSFGPAFGDLLMYLNHKTPHPTELYQMMSNGAKLWQQMRDQVAALRVDAERYRALKVWLADPSDKFDGVIGAVRGIDELDAAIDAAMGDKADAIRGLA